MLSLLLESAAAVGNSWSLPFEDAFIIWLQSLGGKDSFIYLIMQFITLFGEEALLVGTMGLIYWGFDKSRGERVGFMLMANCLLNPMLKNIVCRSRPHISNTSIHNFKDVEGYSFPSGHSSSAAATYGGAAAVYKDKKFKWLWAFAIVMPILVALSRNYLGAHYITDVVCGLALGTCVVILSQYLYKVVPSKYWIYIGALVIGIPGFFYCTTNDFFTGYGILLGFVCGIFFEEKITKFENTKIWWRIALRVAIGGGLFLGLNELFKATVGLIYPTYKENVWFEHIFRVLRYGSIVFLMIGVYPMLFKVGDKLFTKWGWIKDTETTTTTQETISIEDVVTE